MNRAVVQKRIDQLERMLFILQGEKPSQIGLSVLTCKSCTYVIVRGSVCGALCSRNGLSIGNRAHDSMEIYDFAIVMKRPYEPSRMYINAEFTKVW